MRLFGVGLALGCAAVLGWQVSALAQDDIPIDCLTLLMVAEETPDADMSVYDTCGFNNEKIAWSQWAGLASEKKMKKALFQLCDRYPDHMYGSLYCRKSAQLGYGPALAAVGHLDMEMGNVQAAMRFYEQALGTHDLTAEQESAIAERMGIYYLTPNTPQYDPEKAMAFLDKATGGRSALANNVMGYVSFTGSYGYGVHYKKAFEYFWRAILLGCPAAEENLGLFHLVRQEKIDVETATRHMERNLLSCTVAKPKEESKRATVDVSKCKCETVLEAERRYRAAPFLLSETNENTAVLLRPTGAKLLVRLDEKMPEGFVVKEIRKAAVILSNGKDRIVLNKYQPDTCLDYCQNIPEEGNIEAPVQETVKIQPYRLTFTPDECETIRVYAPELVDINLPFTGKVECGMTDEASTASQDELLNLMEAPAPGEKSKAPEKLDLSVSDKSFLHKAGRGLLEPDKEKGKKK